jgi:hypothetical protein
MKALSGVLVALVLVAFGPVSQKAVDIVVTSGGTYVADIHVP